VEGRREKEREVRGERDGWLPSKFMNTPLG